jgi:hypothetical protein
MQALKAELGPNLTQAHKHVSALIKGCKLNILFQDDQLTELVKFSPGRKFKILDGFMKAKRPPFNRPCLYAVVNNRPTDFSWVKCLRNLYDKHDKDKAKRQRAIGAFRVEADKCRSMVLARERYDVGNCSCCDKCCKLAVDHDGKPFAQIVDEFLAHKAMALESVVVSWNGLGNEFRCRLLAAEWHAWHDANAKLIGLCRSCNSSKGSGGYRHKK